MNAIFPSAMVVQRARDVSPDLKFDCFHQPSIILRQDGDLFLDEVETLCDGDKTETGPVAKVAQRSALTATGYDDKAIQPKKLATRASLIASNFYLYIALL